ncbi:MAG: signal peptidase I [Candidatus Marinimicrobia bacterium]|nr:signal peptidase I [Candidatus Neomarinimicrobiota bacterium]
MNDIDSKKESRFWREVRSWVIIILIALGLKSTIVASYMVPTGSMENTIMTGDFLIGNKFLFGARTPDWIGIPYTRIGFNVPSFRLPAFTEPEQGDIIIFKFPRDEHLRYVKRCIAEPGQTVNIKRKKLYVDGNQFELPEHGKFERAQIIPSDYAQPGVFSTSPDNIDNYGPLYVPEKGDTLTVGETPKHILKNILKLSDHEYSVEEDYITVDGHRKQHYIVQQDYYFMMGDNRDNSFDSRYWGFVAADQILGKPLFVFMSWNKNMPLYRITKKIRWNRIGTVVH